MGLIVKVGKRKLLQVPENVVAQIVDDILSDGAHVFDFERQRKSSIKGSDKCQTRIYENLLHVLCRNAHIHDFLEENKNQHGEGGRGQHHKDNKAHFLFVRFYVICQTFYLV